MITILEQKVANSKVRSAKGLCVCLFLHFIIFTSNAQIANYVNNGGFEETYNNCSPPNYGTIAKYWSNADSTAFMGGYFSTCPGLSNAPSNGNTWQFARSGQAYILTGFFCKPPLCTPPPNRGYLKNRLKQPLSSGKTYCAKFYVNIANTSTYGMDGFGAYFGDSSIDTITKCDIPITYLIPQIQNPVNNIITDTLNWIPITGTFVATGNEKYMFIGNFKNDNAVNIQLVNPNMLPGVFTDLCIDDISCIDIDLPASGGPDKSFIPSDSIFIGRQPDVEIDESCTWYKLPNMSTPIATVAGLYVKPMSTSTYVVRQQLWCSSVKWDTVVLYIDAVGLTKLNPSADSGLNEELRIYPSPASDHLEFQLKNENPGIPIYKVCLFNHLGEMLKEQDLIFKERKALINTGDLAEGVYYLQIRNSDREPVNKRFVIAR